MSAFVAASRNQTSPDREHPKGRGPLAVLGRASTRALCILAVAVCAACTGGQVRKDGEPVANADISIWTCESLGDFRATTDGGGNYLFNPFRPDSPTLDERKFIPPGPIAILVTGSAGSSVTRRSHRYDDTCPIAYNGSTQDLPCKVQNVNLVPMSPPEFTAASAAFLEEECGIAAQVAEELSAAHYETSARAIGDLTARPSMDSCLSRCVDSCIFKDAPVSEHQSCMCGCVESQCGASFGPFCTKSGG